MTNPAVALLEDVKGLGPCMQALNAGQRRFVIALFEAKPGQESLAAAARTAGYGTETSSAKSIGNIAYQLSMNPKVKDAIAEFGKSVLRAAGPAIAVRTVLKIAREEGHKDQLKAAAHLLDRFDPIEQRTQHNVTVEHKLSFDEEAIEAIKAARQLGITNEKLAEIYGADGLWRLEQKLAQLEAPKVIEGEFTIVRDEAEEW
jgi:phage terminase small subunit